MERQIIVSGIPEGMSGSILAFGSTLRHYLPMVNSVLVSQDMRHVGDGTVDWIFTYRIRVEPMAKKVAIRMR